MTALHGFLGRPADWDGVLGDDWTKPNWFATPLPPPGKRSGYLDDLATVLNAESLGDTLLGYSMGGRVALHMLLQAPARWRRAVIVSASPGLNGEDERVARLERDLRWAGRFVRDDWEAVVRDWNDQPVFAYDPPDRLPRREADFERRALSSAVVFGSVARQRDLRPELRTLDLPILWIAGAKDSKYAVLAEECAALNPLFTAAILDAGHRVPWGATAAFQKAVADFITIRP